MHLTTETFSGVIVVHTPEELGGDQAARLENYLTTLDHPRVVADLDGTESLDSACLEALLNAQEGLQALGGDLKIATASTINRKILEVTRLDQHLEVFDSVIDAVKSFQ